MPTANEYTKLLLETNKAVQAMHILLDYVDCVNAQRQGLDPKAHEAVERIKELAENTGKEIQNLRFYINDALNKIEIDPDDLKAGANNLILYHNTLDDAIEYTNQQIRGYEENSYWWRYWTGILNELLEKKHEG